MRITTERWILATPSVVLWLAVLLGLAPSARGLELVRPKTPTELLVGTKPDVAYRVRGARVIAFNRPVLEARWPRLAGLNDDEVKRWILDNFAYVNSRQLTLTGIRNTLIDFALEDRKIFWIQPGVGRGAEVEVEGVMVNLKATGNSLWNADLIDEQVDLAERRYVRRARMIDHASGLEAYYVAAAEYLRHFALQNEFDRVNATGRAEIEAVDALFLVDYGFDIMAADENVRAYFMARDAHFGRVSDDARHGPELYEDYGLHQATYAGARIDFGGARTSREITRTFAERAKTLGPDRMEKYVRRELAKIAAEETPARVRQPPHVRASVFRGSPYRRQRLIDPRVLGRGDHVPAPEYIGDARGLARYKWSLFQTEPIQVVHRLRALSDAALIELFAQSRGPLRMPLPEAAYLHGLERAPDVRAMAFLAARPVFARFPRVRERAIIAVLRELDDPTERPVPPHVAELFTNIEDFDGLAEILLAACTSPFAEAARLARARASQVVRVARAQLALGETSLTRDQIAECEDWLSAFAKPEVPESRIDPGP